MLAFRLALSFKAMMFCLALAGIMSVFGQDTDQIQSQLYQDTTQAREWIEMALAFKDSAKFDSAVHYFEHSRELYHPYLQEGSDTILWKLYLDCGNKAGDCLMRSADFDQSLDILTSTLDQGISVLGDTHPIVGDSYNNLGATYLKKGAYSLVLENFQKALVIRQQAYGENHLDVARSHHNIGLFFSAQGKLTKALEHLEKSLNIKIHLRGEGHLDVARTYNSIGVAYFRQGAFSDALTYFQKGLRIRIDALGNNHPDVGNNYNFLGLVYYRNGANALALQHYTRAKDVFSNIFGENHPNVAGVYGNMGLVYKESGAYASALENYYKALAIQLTYLDEDNLNVANSYHNMGFIQMKEGAFASALENYHKALAIRLKAFEGEHPDLGSSYNDIGLVHLHKGEYKKALEYLHKGLLIRERMLGETHVDVANTHNNIGVTLIGAKDYSLARFHHQQALSIRLEVLDNSHPDIADSYNNIGIIETKEGDVSSALKNLKKGLQIRIESFGEHHPDVATSYENVGLAYFEIQDFQAALENFQKALIANSSDFREMDVSTNPLLTHHSFSEPRLLNTLQFKAACLLSLFSLKTNNVSHLQLAFDTYQLSIQLIDKFRQHYKREKDKIELLENVYHIYEGATQTAFLLHQNTHQDSFLHHAYAAIEKSHALLLLEGMAAVDAKTFSGIPEALLLQERNTSSQIHFYEKALFQEGQKNVNIDLEKRTAIQNELFRLRQISDSITQIFETQYPDYFQLKYAQKVSGIEEIQRSLTENQTLLEYLIGDSTLFVFLIRPDTFTALPLKGVAELPSHIQNLRTGIYGPYLHSNPNQDSLKQVFTIAGEHLYQRLIAPIAHLLTEEILIIPDGILAYVPFETLLTKPSSANLPFSAYPFLIKERAISYAFSATLWQEMREKIHATPTSSPLLAVAPTYLSQSSLPFASIEQSRGEYLGPLFYNQEEAQQLQELIDGVALVDTLATRQAFLDEAANHQILHLATHGKINDQDPNYSFLAFYAPDDSIFLADTIQHGLSGLFLADLYSLQLNADLVVLSACETGIGKLYRGEGIASMARGFTYAGAKSIITTLWQINDKETRNFMQSFYSQLKAGQSKRDALQKAKLEMIQHGGFQADPYYWAAYIGMGDMRAIEWKENYSWIWWTMLIGILVAGSIWGTRSISIKRKQKHRNRTT